MLTLILLASLNLLTSSGSMSVDSLGFYIYMTWLSENIDGSIYFFLSKLHGFISFSSLLHWLGPLVKCIIEVEVSSKQKTNLEIGERILYTVVLWRTVAWETVFEIALEEWLQSLPVNRWLYAQRGGLYKLASSSPGYSCTSEGIICSVAKIKVYLLSGVGERPLSHLDTLFLSFLIVQKCLAACLHSAGILVLVFGFFLRLLEMVTGGWHQPPTAVWMWRWGGKVGGWGVGVGVGVGKRQWRRWGRAGILACYWS